MFAGSMIIIFVFASMAAVVIYAYREMIEWGHVVYIVGCTAVVISSFFILPFRNPSDGSIQWGFLWNPPTYIDKSVDRGLAEAIYDQLKQIPNVDVDDDYVEKSLTREMDYSRRISRPVRLVLLLCIVGGWYFVPELINRAIYSTLLAKKRKTG